MKKILLFLVALAFTGICSAQDVIIKKDGSTILAKVLKITETEVEYKNFDNQDGPTRSISISNLQGINYQNGQKEVFSAAVPGIVTGETATQFSNDQELLRMYNTIYNQPDMMKKAKRLKMAGWIVGGTLVATATLVALCGINAKHDGDGYKYKTKWVYMIELPIAAAGVAVWAGCYYGAKSIERESKLSVQSSPIFQQEFNVGKNDRLMVGVDILNDNTMKHQTLGMGIRYNF